MQLQTVSAYNTSFSLQHTNLPRSFSWISSDSRYRGWLQQELLQTKGNVTFVADLCCKKKKSRNMNKLKMAQHQMQLKSMNLGFHLEIQCYKLPELVSFYFKQTLNPITGNLKALSGYKQRRKKTEKSIIIQVQNEKKRKFQTWSSSSYFELKRNTLKALWSKFFSIRWPSMPYK